MKQLITTLIITSIFFISCENEEDQYADRESEYLSLISEDDALGFDLLDDGGAVEDCARTCDGSAILSNGDCTNISYTATIQPIFSTNCTSCHGGSGGLSLSTYTSIIIGGNSGAMVTPGDGSGSLLVKKLRGTASGSQMPKNQDPLDEATINLIETWIDEGALDN